MSEKKFNHTDRQTDRDRETDCEKQYILPTSFLIIWTRYSCEAFFCVWRSFIWLKKSLFITSLHRIQTLLHYITKEIYSTLGCECRQIFRLFVSLYHETSNVLKLVELKNYRFGHVVSECLGKRASLSKWIIWGCVLVILSSFTTWGFRHGDHY